MSDYLWDRKGEPDADVARLESLLGALAHERSPLEWPAEVAAPEPPPSRLLTFAPRLRASRLFAPAALAAAAALLVASLLAASAFLRARVPTGSERAAAPESARPTAGAPKEERPALKEERPAQRAAELGMLEPPPRPGVVKDEVPAVVVKNRDEKALVESLPRVARRRGDFQLAAALKRRQRDLSAEPSAATQGAGNGFTLEALTMHEGTSSLVEGARLLTKEQLVYALRFTGAKLRDVREKAQGTAQD